MSDDDRLRWNAKHAAGHASDDAPAPFLVACAPRLPLGRALDVACGAGRNAAFLAERGFDVLGVDVSDTALERAAELACRRGVVVGLERRDVTAGGLPAGPWDVIACFYFLDRALWPAFRRELRPGGALIVETYTTVHADRTGFRRDFCLEPGELREAFADLHVVECREDDETGTASLLAMTRGAAVVR